VNESGSQVVNYEEDCQKIKLLGSR